MILLTLCSTLALAEVEELESTNDSVEPSIDTETTNDSGTVDDNQEDVESEEDIEDESNVSKSDSDYGEKNTKETSGNDNHPPLDSMTSKPMFPMIEADEEVEESEHLEESTSGTETFGQVTSVLGFNRVSLALIGQYGINIPKWEKEGSTLFQGTGIQFVGELRNSPAYTRPGVRVTVTPIAVLQLQAYAFGSAYFGNLQTILAYDSAHEQYGTNEDIANYSESTGRQYSSLGYNAGGNAVLQAKVGNIVFKNTFDYSYWNIPTPDEEVAKGGVATFEREKEVMMMFDGDQMIENNTLLLYQIDREKDKFYRVGNLTSYRQSLGTKDILLRTGLIAIAQTSAQNSHILIVQPYLQDKTYDAPFAPYFVYAFKHIY